MAFTTFAENLTKSLEPMLASYSATLLQKISEDYNLSYEELSQKYLTTPTVPPPKAKGQPRATGTGTKKKTTLPQCTGLTAKGGQCSHKAFDDSGLCRIHQRKAGQSQTQAAPLKEPKAKRVSKKKTKEPTPVHTHEPTEVDPLCGLCESHGNPMNPELPSKKFESDDLAERLKKLIMAEGEPEGAEPVIASSETLEPIEESDEEDEETQPIIQEPVDEYESDYEDEGEALTQALRKLVMADE